MYTFLTILLGTLTLLLAFEFLTPAITFERRCEDLGGKAIAWDYRDICMGPSGPLEIEP